MWPGCAAQCGRAVAKLLAWAVKQTAVNQLLVGGVCATLIRAELLMACPSLITRRSELSVTMRLGPPCLPVCLFRPSVSASCFPHEE